MTGNLKLLCNFVEKFLGTVCFGNDQFAPILGYGDLIQTMTPRSSMFKRRLITADQASVFIAMTSVHISLGLVLHQMTSVHNRSELGIQDHSNEQSSSKLVPKVVP
ncbi:hypothetical protein Tco_0124763 [Tanacetum coccineum]